MTTTTTILHKWDKLSPREFLQLQELTSYSTRKLQDVLQEFCSPHALPKFNPDGGQIYMRVLQQFEVPLMQYSVKFFGSASSK
uniref:Diacylglycerol kinase type I N-terminal domain-containing protein n=1 Tax=Glossina palpalis gambiensis TaxID=67801 RepID=A0A1B0BVE2_9MUSC